MLAQQRAVRAEILLALLDPPPEIPLRERLRALWRSPMFFVREMPKAAYRAEALLRQALTYPPFADQQAYWYARINVHLALLSARGKAKHDAREAIGQVRTLAIQHDAQALISKVDRALARLSD